MKILMENEERKHIHGKVRVFVPAKVLVNLGSSPDDVYHRVRKYQMEAEMLRDWGIWWSWSSATKFVWEEGLFEIGFGKIVSAVDRMKTISGCSPFGWLRLGYEIVRRGWYETGKDTAVIGGRVLIWRWEERRPNMRLELCFRMMDLMLAWCLEMLNLDGWAGKIGMVKRVGGVEHVKFKEPSQPWNFSAARTCSFFDSIQYIIPY